MKGLFLWDLTLAYRGAFNVLGGIILTLKTLSGVKSGHRTYNGRYLIKRTGSQVGRSHVSHHELGVHRRRQRKSTKGDGWLEFCQGEHQTAASEILGS